MTSSGIWEETSTFSRQVRLASTLQCTSHQAAGALDKSTTLKIYKHKVCTLGLYIFTCIELIIRLGFTYNFLGPENLQLPEAVVSDGLLAPNGPGYKTLIFLNNTQIDNDVLSKVREFDRVGLPIFFVGEVQEQPISSKPNETYNSVDMVNELISRGKNIHRVSTNDDLPAALARACLTPPRAIHTNGQLHPQRLPHRGKIQNRLHLAFERR
jgi:hypothetical protein